MKNSLFTSRRKKTGLIFILLAGIVTFAYCMTQGLVMNTQIIMLGAKEDQQLEPNEIQQAMDDLVNGGPEAQERVIRAIKSPGSWERTIFRCAQVMKRRGRPAHQALLAAIKTEKSPMARCNCIWVLQEAFKDYSQLDLYLSSLVAPDSSRYADQTRQSNAENLMYQLQEHFQDGAPPLLSMNGWGPISRNFDPDFRDWCKAHTGPKGPLYQRH